MRAPLIIGCCAVAAMAAAQQPVTPARISEARIAADGHAIVFARQAGVGADPLALFRITFGGGDESLVAALDGRVSHLRWSPVGDAVAYLTRPAPGAPRELHVVPAAGGTPRALVSGAVDVVAFTWSGDGRRVLYEAVPAGAPEEGPRQWNVAALETPTTSTAPFAPLESARRVAGPLVPIVDAKVLFVTPLANGQQALTLTNGKETWIDLVSADARITVMPPGLATIVEPPSWSADGTRFAVVGVSSAGTTEVFAGSLPLPQPTGANMGARPPRVRQITGKPQ